MKFEIGKLYEWDPSEKHRNSTQGFSAFPEKKRNFPGNPSFKISLDESIFVLEQERTPHGYCLKVLAASSNVGYIFIDDRYVSDWARIEA